MSGVSPASAERQASNTSQPSVFVHVGLPKTGTTQLQGVLFANRRRLLRQGVLYPGARNAAHWMAALDLLGSAESTSVGAWDAIVQEIASSSAPTALVSHEMLAGLRGRKIRRLLSDFADREVHMVVTLRDFSRIVAATWQERAKNREVEAWPEFLDAIAAGPEGKHRFWRLQDAPRVLESWHRFIPAERIHVVTIPPLSADRLLLLRRFSEVLGIDAQRLRIPEEEANQSIGAVEIALLQRVNAASADLDLEAYRRWVKRYLVQKLLAKRPGQVRVVLPETSRSWVEAETQRIRNTIDKLGCNVVGSLDELEPTAIGTADDARLTDRPDAVEVEEVLEASSEVVVQLLGEIRRLREDAAEPEPEPPWRSRWLARQPGRIQDVVDRLRSRRPPDRR